METLINNVYSALKSDTAGIQNKLAEYEKLEEKAKSGAYSTEYLNTTLNPQKMDLKASIERDKAEAINHAKGLVKAFQDDLRDKDALHPEDITEDVKLFTAGIKLNSKDIESILNRNKDNSTMTQIALRYAEENGVDLPGNKFYGHTEAIQEAEDIKSVIDYYDRWIDKPNAFNILDKFFNR